MGFAVAVEDIRKPAERSAKSTKKIAELIFCGSRFATCSLNFVFASYELFEFKLQT